MRYAVPLLVLLLISVPAPVSSSVQTIIEGSETTHITAIQDQLYAIGFENGSTMILSVTDVEPTIVGHYLASYIPVNGRNPMADALLMNETLITLDTFGNIDFFNTTTGQLLDTLEQRSATHLAIWDGQVIVTKESSEIQFVNTTDMSFGSSFRLVDLSLTEEALDRGGVPTFCMNCEVSAAIDQDGDLALMYGKSIISLSIRGDISRDEPNERYQIDFNYDSDIPMIPIALHATPEAYYIEYNDHDEVVEVVRGSMDNFSYQSNIIKLPRRAQAIFAMDEVVYLGSSGIIMSSEGVGWKAVELPSQDIEVTSIQVLEGSLLVGSDSGLSTMDSKFTYLYLISPPLVLLVIFGGISAFTYRYRDRIAFLFKDHHKVQPDSDDTNEELNKRGFSSSTSYEQSLESKYGGNSE